MIPARLFPQLAAVLGLLLGGSVLFGFAFFSSKDRTPAPQEAIQALAEMVTAQEPTPTPFQELTIPYLRSRKYDSQLDEQKRLSETATYTTYLTSYDSDDNTINALLTVPKGDEEKKWPAIVFVHGYIPPTLYKTTEKYEDYVNYLARNGFVVLKIDLRGHGTSEGLPGGAYYSSDYIVDTLNAYNALEKASFVDASKIGLWGHSMGGNVVMRSLAAKPEIPAIAIWGGAVHTYEDMTQYGIDDNSYRPPSSPNPLSDRRRQLFEIHGSFDPENEFWKQVPAVNYLSEIQGAVGLFHSVNDDVVNVEYSRNLNTILDSTSIDHEFHEYQSGGHNISGAAFTQAMRDTVAFYKKHLGE